MPSNGYFSPRRFTLGSFNQLTMKIFTLLCFLQGSVQVLHNKLGLSWVKLSPSWDWNVIKIYYIELITKIK